MMGRSVTGFGVGARSLLGTRNRPGIFAVCFYCSAYKILIVPLYQGETPPK